MPEQIKILVSGSRDWCDVDTIRVALFEYLWKATNGIRPEIPPLLIHGAATGADTIAAKIFTRWNLPTLPVPVTHEDWEMHGKRAGRIRNERMITMRPDILLAFPLPHSKGTYHCIERAEFHGIPWRSFPSMITVSVHTRKGAAR